MLISIAHGHRQLCVEGLGQGRSQWRRGMGDICNTLNDKNKFLKILAQPFAHCVNSDKLLYFPPHLFPPVSKQKESRYICPAGFS